MENNCDICNQPIGNVVSLVGKKKYCRNCANKFAKESESEKGFMNMLENIK